MIYVDPSALVPIIADEAQSAFVEQVLGTVGTVLISDFGIGEVTSAIARTVRTGQASRADGAAMLQDFDEWQIARATMLACTSIDIRQATNLIRRMDLPLKLPDAIHLALCRRHQATLFTLDAQMRSNAMSLDIDVAPLS